MFNRFIHFYTFCLGKGKLKKCYKGFALRFNFYFFTIKIERVGFRNNFNWKFELSNWKE